VSDALLELAAVSKRYLDNPSFVAKLLGLTRTVHAVTEVSLSLARGETLGLVGESGCGKSTLARCIIALEPVSAGEMRFAGRAVEAERQRRLRWFRSRAQIVFQDPQSSLNRSLTVEQILARALKTRAGQGGRDARRARIAELLRTVGLGPAFLHRYSHELSGGQCQRVGIARALAVEPEFVVLDEPVSALDVSIQAQIVNLLLHLQARLGLTYLFISHDLNLVRYVSDRIAVMYLGRIVELGPAEEISGRPRHPYTQLLLAAAPQPDPARRDESVAVTGEVPSPFDPPSGCAFHPRCPLADARCRRERPELRRVAPAVEVACHRYEQAQDPVPALTMVSKTED
jgi:peptide/nickel transport system ATP-binding protein